MVHFMIITHDLRKIWFPPTDKGNRFEQNSSEKRDFGVFRNRPHESYQNKSDLTYPILELNLSLNLEG